MRGLGAWNMLAASKGNSMRLKITLFAVALAVSWAQPGSAQTSQADTVEDGRVQLALEAIAEADSDKLLRDKVYAEQILNHLETVRTSESHTGEQKDALDWLRMLALMGAGRTEEAHRQSSDLLDRDASDVGRHYFALLLAAELGGDRALLQLERANRSLQTTESRAELAEAIDVDLIYFLRRPFNEANDKAKLARSAQLLLSLGVPGPNYPEMADSFRLDIADDLLARGDIAGARKAVHEIRMVRPVLSSLIAKRWSPTWEPSGAGERLAQAIAATDEATERSMRADPTDTRLLLMRAQHLRSVGREEEALRLLLTKAENFDWVKKEGEYGYWVVNEAGYALVSLNRAKEAIALMDRLMTVGLEANPALISMAINAAEIMRDAGEYRRAAQHSTMLADKHADVASAYGRMWMWSGAACGHFLAGENALAGPWLAKVKAGEDDNPAAVTRTLLCANDIDGAAASVIRRLQGKDPDAMLKALQNYTIRPELTPPGRLLDDRLRKVVARPEVQAAIAAQGRILDLPLSKSYWGMF